MANWSLFRIVLGFGTFFAILVTSVQLLHHRRFKTTQIHKMRQEALNVSHYAEELVKRIQTSGLVKHEVPDIYNLVENLQRFGDGRRIKKYMIQTFGL